MAEQSRAPFTPTRPGPYVGIVVGNQDSTFMGTLEVAIVNPMRTILQMLQANQYLQDISVHFLEQLL